MRERRERDIYREKERKRELTESKFLDFAWHFELFKLIVVPKRAL
jgi:hypothetical protein